MDKVFGPDSSFDFTKLSLGHPQTTKGGSYFTKILFDNQSVYVQFPKCKTKQGIIQTDKNIYVDLLYETSYNNELNEWFENLEGQCQKLLFEKNNLWFSGDIELSDIESAFTNSAKMYKSGKQFLVRCYIPKPQIIKTAPSCFVYDESEKQLALNDVDVTREIIPLVKIDGIKFTNKSFQLELILTQIMVMNVQDDFKQCLIKPSISNKTTSQPMLPPNSIQLSREKLQQGSGVEIPIESTNQNEASPLPNEDEKEMAVSISFPEKNNFDLESTNVIDNLYVSEDSEASEESETEGVYKDGEGEEEDDDEEEDEEDDDEEEDEEDDDEEEDEEDEEDEDEEDEDEEEDEDSEDDGEVKDKQTNEINLIGGVNKDSENNLVEVNDLEITDPSDFFQKNKHLQHLLTNSFPQTNSIL